MAKLPKKCKLCGERPAAVPDRDRQGRMFREVGRECHTERLRKDLAGIILVLKADDR